MLEGYTFEVVSLWDFFLMSLRSQYAVHFRMTFLSRSSPSFHCLTSLYVLFILLKPLISGILIDHSLAMR